LAIFINRLLFIILLIAPLAVYWLPNFQTTYEEDFLLLGIFLYVFMRMLNSQRKQLPDSHQIVLIFALMGVMYAVGWMGLMRGYLNTAGQTLMVYPLALLIAAITTPIFYQKKTQIYQWIIQLLLSITIVVFLLSFISWVSAVTPFPFSTKSLIAPLLLFPILSCVGLLSCSIGQLNRVSGHFLLLLAALLSCAVPWYENVKTYAYWYRAGELERAWTPYKYQDPQKIAEAKQKPIEAARYYFMTYNRILKKGEIPLYLNWPFFLRYRMAYQAMRMENPPLGNRKIHLPMQSI